MNEAYVGGVALTVAGLAAYAVGVGTAYPGRSFSVTAVMVGLTLAVVGLATEPEGSG